MNTFCADFNKKVGKGLTALLVGTVLVLLVACQNSTSSPSAPAKITRVGWFVENIEPSYWTATPHRPGQLFYDFFLHYTGSFSASDVKTARVYLPGGTTWWTIDPAVYLDNTNKILGGYNRWYSGSDSNDDALPLGTLKAVIEFNNGTSTSFDFTPHKPNALVNGGYTYVATAAKASVIGSTLATPAVSFPTSVVANKTASGVTVAFTLNDLNINSGYLWFFDASDKYLGGFFDFRDSKTNAVSTLFTPASTFHTSGNNSITIPQASLSPADSTINTADMLSNMTKVVVVVIDGAQYTPLGYADNDYTAISARQPITGP